ncbi:MAG: BlaI/MecI/CopY family transcriptional regulator [Lachnospiraceae bacterium]|nr:BlaI/MecI/CopY family transcriptional regulator [Lachnospiraceae bacterium]
MYLTKSEMEIMQTFWKNEGALSLNELIEASPNRCWKDRSGFSIIKSLLKKGLLKEDGFVHSGKTIARTFSPNISCTDFMIGQLDEYDGNINFSKLFARLLGNDKIRTNDINELDMLISKKKKELKAK